MKNNRNIIHSFLLGLAAGLSVIVLVLIVILAYRLINQGSGDDTADNRGSTVSTQATTAATTTASTQATTAATTTASTQATTAATTTASTQATTAATTEKPKPKLSVTEKSWKMNSHFKEFTVKNKNKDSDIYITIDDEDVIAGVTRNKEKKGKFKVQLYARKNGKTKVHIHDKKTSEELTVKVTVNLKTNKYLSVGNTRVTMTNSATIKIRDDHGEAFYINSFYTAGLLSTKWSESYGDGYDIDLTITRGDIASGESTFVVVKDRDTKESELIEVYIK